MVAAAVRRSGRIAVETWGLAGLCAGGAARFGAAAAHPLDGRSPAVLDLALGVACAVLAVLIWIAGTRRPRAVDAGVLALLCVLVTVLVAQSSTLGGAMVSGTAFLLIGLYTGLVFRPRAVIALVAFTGVCFALGLGLDHAPGAVTAWLTVTLATAMAALATSSLVRQLHRVAEEDPVTGALNRRGLLRAGDRCVAAAERYGHPLSAVLVDLDGFKQTNDRLGHVAGDAVLAAVAERWRAELRRADVLARSGGDEFVVLLPSTADEGARRLAARLMASAGTACSAGSATYVAGDTLATLLHRADAEMYRVKRARQAATSNGRIPASRSSAKDDAVGRLDR